MLASTSPAAVLVPKRTDNTCSKLTEQTTSDSLCQPVLFICYVLLLTGGGEPVVLLL